MPPKKGAKAAAKAAPKRKAPAKGKGRGGKKSKAEEPEESEEEEVAAATAKDFAAKLKAADKGKKRQAKPDSFCPLSGSATVVDDYDCMLNQTNIGHNNNKYYIIQVLQVAGSFYHWNRWGRVGEGGQNALKGPLSKELAMKDFEKKFRDKTKNKWSEREDFTPAAGKYTMLEMDAQDDDDDDDTAEKMAMLDEIDGVERVVADCTLDKSTQSLVKMIFDNDMFKEAMKQMDIDVKKMPLGKLSKTQIAKGFEVLDEIEKAVEGKKPASKLSELSSRFYTLIPHDFGRQRPAPLTDLEMVRKKMDMLLVLGDIELAQAMQKDKDKVEKTDTTEVPHPLDENYDMLQCDLELLDKKSKDFKVIQNYLSSTEGYHKLKIQDVWRVDRGDEEDRYSVHDELDNRKLLWHGTNVAVVAAILKGGLRIMPHSGGRVGKGIYFASENGKSAGYVRCAATGVGIMFLNEVALGKEHHITTDDWTLKQPPKGYDSIIAKGRTEPDPTKDTHLMINEKKVVVPQGRPINQAKYSTSTFSQSEYLIYKESQNCLRYLLKLKFN